MSGWDYKVVPAPIKGEKARGVKAAEDRFALAVERAINALAAQGWEYQRAETLPSEERTGLTNSVTVWRNVLVFRRARTGDLDAFAPRLLEAPEDAESPPDGPDPASDRQEPAGWDNGVEDTGTLHAPGAALRARADKMRGTPR